MVPILLCRGLAYIMSAAGMACVGFFGCPGA